MADNLTVASFSIVGSAPWPGRIGFISTCQRCLDLFVKGMGRELTMTEIANLVGAVARYYGRDSDLAQDIRNTAFEILAGNKS